MTEIIMTKMFDFNYNVFVLVSKFIIYIVSVYKP